MSCKNQAFLASDFAGALNLLPWQKEFLFVMLKNITKIKTHVANSRFSLEPADQKRRLLDSFHPNRNQPEFMPGLGGKQSVEKGSAA